MSLRDLSKRRTPAFKKRSRKTSSISEQKLWQGTYRLFSQKMNWDWAYVVFTQTQRSPDDLLNDMLQSFVPRRWQFECLSPSEENTASLLLCAPAWMKPPPGIEMPGFWEKHLTEIIVLYHHGLLYYIPKQGYNCCWFLKTLKDVWISWNMTLTNRRRVETGPTCQQPANPLMRTGSMLEEN